jgi:hypothetical protein
MVLCGDFLRVPFLLIKNGHESIDSLYTLREFALAAKFGLDRCELQIKRSAESADLFIWLERANANTTALEISAWRSLRLRGSRLRTRRAGPEVLVTMR